MNFLHSGSLGDIIYSLPTIKCLKTDFAKANLYLRPDVYSTIPRWSGTRAAVRMTGKEAAQLVPLLSAQETFKEVALYDNQRIDVHLDEFRTSGFPFDRGDIARYYCYAFKSKPVLHLPWLKVEPSPEYKKAILVNRTNRYRNPAISYSFLSGRPDVYFVGYPDEYTTFIRDCARVPFLQAVDALQLARWIAGCKLFVGNQSFPFAIAEALKTPRILEVYPQVPNVQIHGPRGYDCIGQDLFEEIVKSEAK